MAFTTEFVMGAGGSIDYLTAPTAAYTSNNSSWSTLLSTSVGPGSWLLVFDSTKVGAPSYEGLSEIRSGPVTSRVEASGPIVSGSPLRLVRILTGPTSVTVEARYVRLAAGTVHLARIA